MVRKNQFLLPIVHTEGDFFAPLTIGDQVEVRLSFSKIGQLLSPIHQII